MIILWDWRRGRTGWAEQTFFQVEQGLRAIISPRFNEAAAVPPVAILGPRAGLAMVRPAPLEHLPLPQLLSMGTPGELTPNNCLPSVLLVDATQGFSPLLLTCIGVVL